MIPTIPQDRANSLLRAAQNLNEAPFTRQERQRIEIQARAAYRQRRVQRNGDTSVIFAYNGDHPIDGSLERYGYIKGAGGRFIRPGGKSESVSVKDGRSCHWSSNDPLNDGKVISGCGVHDSFDLFAYFDHGGDLKAAVKAAAKQLGLNAVQPPQHQEGAEQELWPDPLPLPAGLPPVLPYDFGLLPTSLHAWIRDISERMQCPPDYCAATAMVVAGALVGRKVAIRPKAHDDWQVVPNLYGAMVGRPSLMKSPAMQEVLKFLRKLEVEAKAEYAKALAEYAAAAMVAEATKKVKKEAIKKAVKDGGDAQAIAEEIASDETGEPSRP